MQNLLMDLNGVIYDGGEPVAGAARALAWLREQAIPGLFVTNTMSRPRAGLVERLTGMGIVVAEAEILTPPVAAMSRLRRHVDGPVALFVPDATAAEFADLEIADLPAWWQRG